MDTHLHHDHKEEHLKSSDLLRDVVIGMSDGLTVPFALAAGLSGAVDSTSIIVIAGIAEIAAGSIAMGLGGYLAGKTEQDHYTSELKREYYEVENLRHREIEETKEFFKNIGLSEELQDKATQEIAKDKKQWVDFMMKYELGLEKTRSKKSYKISIEYWSLLRCRRIGSFKSLFFYRYTVAGIKHFISYHFGLSFCFWMVQK